MSTATASDVRYVPTEAERRANLQRRLEQQRHRLGGLVSRLEGQMAEWRDRVPRSQEVLSALEVPIIAADGSSDLSAQVALATAEVDRFERAINDAVRLCIAEEVRVLARRATTDQVLAQAHDFAVAAGAGASVRRRQVDIGEETFGADEADFIEVKWPSLDERLSRVESILDRGKGKVSAEDAQRCLQAAAAAADLIRYRSVLEATRQTVEAAAASAQKAEKQRARAAGLLDRLGGLEGESVKSCRAFLEDALAGGGPLPEDAEAAVAEAIAVASQERLIEVLRRAGCDLAPVEGGAAVGYVSNEVGRSKILLDRRGLVVSAVAGSPLDEVAANQLEQRTCELNASIVAEAAAAGLAIRTVSCRQGPEAIRLEPDDVENVTGSRPAHGDRRPRLRSAPNTIRRAS
jgi:hypothetical protein